MTKKERTLAADYCAMKAGWWMATGGYPKFGHSSVDIGDGTGPAWEARRECARVIPFGTSAYDIWHFWLEAESLIRSGWNPGDGVELTNNSRENTSSQLLFQ